MKHDCPICKGIGWVCENCPDQPWSEDVGCICGAGMLCECQRKSRDVVEGVDEPDVSQVFDGPCEACTQSLSAKLFEKPLS